MAVAACSRVVFWYICFLGYAHFVLAQTGYIYQLDTEYAGANFFQGWDFFTVITRNLYSVAGTDIFPRQEIRLEAT